MLIPPPPAGFESAFPPQVSTLPDDTQFFQRGDAILGQGGSPMLVPAVLQPPADPESVDNGVRHDRCQGPVLLTPSSTGRQSVFPPLVQRLPNHPQFFQRSYAIHGEAASPMFVAAST